MGIHILTSDVCLKCDVQFDNWCSTLDLICLPLHDIDRIIGMDWMSSNHALLNCLNKTISLLVCSTNYVSSIGSPCLNIVWTKSYFRDNCEGVLVFFSMQVEVEKDIEKIPVVRKTQRHFLKSLVVFHLRERLNY